MNAVAERTYSIPSPYYVIHDAPSDEERLERLRFHIERGDYFPMLATILGFLGESIIECGPETKELRPMQYELLKSVKKDLMHLHQHYDITPKA